MRTIVQRMLWGSLVAGVMGSTEMSIAQPMASQSKLISPYQQLVQTRHCSGCNLSNLDLRGLNLAGADLNGANLSNANLSGSNLNQANLSNANLYLANLSGSNLSQAQFTGASLKSANLSAASLNKTRFDQTVATYANLSKASFIGASIQDSDFSDSNLSQSTFDNARISNTRLQYSNLAQANFSSAFVVNTSFAATSGEGVRLPGSKTTLLSQQPITQPAPIPPEAFEAEASEAEMAEPDNSESESIDTQTTEQEQTESLPAPSDLADNKLDTSPLRYTLFPQPSARQLNRGDVVIGFPTNRQFFNSDTQNNDATAANLGVHLDWGITDTTELGLSFQIVDTGSPGTQGPFNVRREQNRDVTVRLKQRIWDNANQDLAISVVPSIAFGDRNYEFRGVGPRQVFTNNDVVPALQIPITKTLDKDRLNLTLSPTAVFFPEEHALFLRRLPLPNSGSFGTNVGVAGAVSYAVNPRLTLWGDAFVPFTGNNSLNLNTGLPAKTIAFNSGLRFFVNPRIGLDLFASNTLGQRTPLGITAERNNVALGLGVSVMPELFSGNRRYGDSFNPNDDGTDSPMTVDGLSFADGGTVPKNRFALQVQGGQQGILTSLRYGVLRDFEIFGYLDYVLGRVDESEQGFGVKVRLLDQESNGPFTVSATASVGLTNEVFRNFINNDPTAFNTLGLNKEVPLVFQVDNPEGRRFLVSASLPIHYKVNDRLNTWFTPTLGYAQRLGVELAGFNLGGSLEVVRDVSVVAEVGANFIGRGNSFNQTRLVDRIPWTFAARWNPSALFGRKENSLTQPHVELYVTNRTGSSIWNQLRVREGGDPAVGVGVLVPF